MSSIYRYFRDVYLGVVTVSIGMWVTFQHFFVRAVTVQYPHQKLTYPPRARTLLAVTFDTCNGCQQCTRACPVEIIHIETVKALPDEDLGTLPDGKPKKLHVVLFDVEMSKCVHCGLCTEVCPTGSIHWENIHEEVGVTRGELMRHWSTYSAEERERLLERDAKLKAEKEAKMAAAAAAKEAAAAKASAEKPEASAGPAEPKAEAASSDPPAEPAPEPKQDEPAEPPESSGEKEDAS